MQQEKGQIEIVLFVLVIIGAIVLFFVFAKPGNKETANPDTSSKVSSPAAPKAPEKDYSSPSPVSDSNPPVRYNVQPTGPLAASTKSTTITLDTNEKAICRYSEVSNMGYGAMKIFAHTNAAFHYTEINGLAENKGYPYYIKCADAEGNANPDDFLIYFYVKAPDDFAQPVRSNQYPTGEALPRGTTQTIIGISTNEPATCRYDARQNISYDSMSKSMTDDGTQKYHTAQIAALLPGVSYNYFIRCKDLNNNANTGDVMVSFIVQ